VPVPRRRAPPILPTVVSDVRKAVGASKKDVTTAITYLKAVAALYGSIIFWYGAWTQMDVGFTQLGWCGWCLANASKTPERCIDSDPDDLSAVSPAPYNPYRDLTYAVVGSFVLVLMDALYANAGVTGNCWAGPRVTTRALQCVGSHPRQQQQQQSSGATGSATAWIRSAARQGLAQARALVALLASVSLWLGWYNIVNADVCFTQVVRKVSVGHFQLGHLLRYRFQLAVALVLFWLTKTFYVISGVAVEESPPEAEIAGHTSTVIVQLRAFLRANISIFAQTLWFSGAYLYAIKMHLQGNVRT
jgi:hypothetical protein